MKNGYFQVDCRKDGTYLIIYPPVDGGEYCSAPEIMQYLSGFNVDYDKKVIVDSVKPSSEKREVRITTLRVSNMDETVSVSVTDEGLSAIARFYPESVAGRKISEEDIMSCFARKGIRYGIDTEQIRKYLSERNYCTNYVVARALPPTEGSDAQITYNFNTDITQKPKLNEDGSVDFHQLDTLSRVDKDQVLATLKPAVQGVPGTDVMGRPIKPRKVNIQFLRQSKNTKISADRLQLISMVSGHAVLMDGQVFVSDTYEVPGNVDASTGDIDYNGNVSVAGNVNSGYKVHATGDIIVNGIVEGAVLVAEGQIILKRGIQGMGKGLLQAGTNVIAKFIESAEVIAKGFIQTEAIMHSNVQAGAEITVRGKKGFITGGSIKSGRYIEAKTAGSVMGTQTIIEVGENIALADEMKRLNAERKKISEDIDKANKIIAFISKKIKDREQLPPEKLTQFQQLTVSKTQMMNRTEAIDERIDQIYAVLDNYSNGYVLIDDVIYPGCKVTVSNVSTFIHSETKHCRLMRDGADIRVKAY